MRQGVERATEADGEERAQIREEGVGRAAQDATFINADPGASDSSSPRSTAETRRSRDGSWTKMKKGSRSYFGYKIHVKADLEYGLIRAIRATTALCTTRRWSSLRGPLQGQCTCAPTKGYDATIQHGTRAGPISLRKAKEREDIKEAGTDREGICGAQEVLQCRARYGHDLT